VVIAEDSAQTIYVITDQKGILRSSDGGAGWTPVNTGLESSFALLQLIVNPARPEELYLLVNTHINEPFETSNAIYRSPDRGDSWQPVAAPAALGGTRQISADPLQPDSLHAATASGLYTLNPVTGVSTPFAPVWWDPDKSGQGVTLLRQNNRLWGEWHHYDAQGSAA
jgi:hypothetical protein